jgi:hypothetical protein
MTKDEALKLALEALESKYIVNCGAWRVQQDKAITAIKEALAQPEHEPVGKFAKFTDGILREVTDGSAGVPLYTSPPQRTWVGLTDEEAQQTFAKHNCTISTHLAGILARAIEAKLKEKNS